jgi:mono/diheme cytochrome c family protein
MRKLVLLASVIALAGCRQQMAHQPAYRPLAPSAFFSDQRSARPLVEGTVPRGELRQGPFFTGRKSAAEVGAREGAALIANPDLPGAAVFGTVEADYLAYLDALPFAPEKLPRMARRGQERFNIFCSPCHDRAGMGQGMIVERGYLKPPSFHTDLSRGFLLRNKSVKLRDVPVGYYFEVITNGFGAMPSYRKQVPPADRWAIVAYIRVLQLSQDANLDEVADRRDLKVLQAKPDTP